MFITKALLVIMNILIIMTDDSKKQEWLSGYKSQRIFFLASEATIRYPKVIIISSTGLFQAQLLVCYWHVRWTHAAGSYTWQLFRYRLQTVSSAFIVQ